MAYEHQCGGCLNFKDKDNTYKLFDTRWANSEKGYCDWYRCFYWADDSCSSHYEARNPEPSCYITTIVCKILDYPDDCGVLNTLRTFRDEVLQKDEKYLPLLMEYDIVGPKIAYALEEDYEKTQDIEFATYLFNFYILPTASFVHEKKNDEAVRRYQEMMVGLEEYYSVAPDNSVSYQEYDATRGGHGRVYKKNLQEI